jgi:hypothetical protein
MSNGGGKNGDQFGSVETVGEKQEFSLKYGSKLFLKKVGFCL